MTRTSTFSLTAGGGTTCFVQGMFSFQSEAAVGSISGYGNQNPTGHGHGEFHFRSKCGKSLVVFGRIADRVLQGTWNFPQQTAKKWGPSRTLQNEPFCDRTSIPVRWPPGAMPSSRAEYTALL